MRLRSARPLHFFPIRSYQTITMGDEQKEPFWENALGSVGKTIKRTLFQKWVIKELRKKALRYESLPPDSSLKDATEIHAWEGTNAVFRSYKEYSKGRPKSHSEGYTYSPGAMFVVWGKGDTGKTCAVNALAHCNTPCLPSKALSLHLDGQRDPYDQILRLLNFRQNADPTDAALELCRAVKGNDDDGDKQMTALSEGLKSAANDAMSALKSPTETADQAPPSSPLDGLSVEVQNHEEGQSPKRGKSLSDFIRRKRNKAPANSSLFTLVANDNELPRAPTLSLSRELGDDDDLDVLQVNSAEDSATSFEHKKYGGGDKRPVIAIHNINTLEKKTNAYSFLSVLMRFAAESQIVVFVTTNDEMIAYLLLQLNEGTKVCPLHGFKENIDEWDENDSHHKSIIDYLGEKPKFEYMIRKFDFEEEDKVKLLKSIRRSVDTDDLRRFVRENQKLSVKELIAKDW
jgi:hypothetical protein